jgi:hypothetical protein
VIKLLKIYEFCCDRCNKKTQVTAVCADLPTGWFVVEGAFPYRWHYCSIECKENKAKGDIWYDN